MSSLLTSVGVVGIYILPLRVDEERAQLIFEVPFFIAEKTRELAEDLVIRSRSR